MEMSKGDILDRLMEIGGKVYRRHPKEDKHSELICSATWLGDDLWLTVDDRGLYGGTIRGQWRGLLEVVDIWIKPDNSEEFIPAVWTLKTPMRPVAVIKTATGKRPGVKETKIGSTAASAQQDYMKLFRNDDGLIYDSSIYDRPWPVRYDVDREEAIAVVGRCDMGYRMRRTEYGSPMLDGDGSLMGVIVGSDWGTDSSHAGFYVPADFLIPSLDLMRAMVMRKNAGDSTWRIGIDHVSHESFDVYEDE